MIPPSPVPGKPLWLPLLSPAKGKEKAEAQSLGHLHSITHNLPASLFLPCGKCHSASVAVNKSFVAFPWAAAVVVSNSKLTPPCHRGPPWGKPGVDRLVGLDHANLQTTQKSVLPLSTPCNCFSAELMNLSVSYPQRTFSYSRLFVWIFQVVEIKAASWTVWKFNKGCLCWFCYSASLSSIENIHWQDFRKWGSS